MKFTVTAGLIAAALFAAGPLQAACSFQQSGWHMVSKKCAIKQADNWQEYNSGIYIQPAAGKSILSLMNQ
jgi:hypothetical protein